MMKKLLVLVLVLVIAPVASADLTWSITGNSGPGGFDVSPSDAITATLTLGGGGTSRAISFGVVTDQGPATGPQRMTDSLLAAGYSGTHFDGWTAAEAAGYGLTGYGPGDAVYIIGSTPSADPAVSGTLVTLYYTVDPAAVIGSTINIIAMAGAGGSSNIVDIVYGTEPAAEFKPPTLGLNVVPEPMTVLLLGLGGLFLRRRKR